MTASTEELEKRIAYLAGQLAVSAIAINALLRHCNLSDSTLREIDEGYEKSISQALNRPFNESFLEGMQSFSRHALGRK